jgi:sialidase-1
MRSLITLSLLAACEPAMDVGLDASVDEATTDFVAYWRLDDTTDATGANPLTLAGGANINPGKFGSALTLDGIDDHAVRATPTATLRPAAAFAISAWVNLTSTDTSGAEVASMGDNYGLRIAADGNVKSWFWDPVTYRMATTSGVNIKDGAWHHLVGQYTGSRVQVFVDGTLRAELAATGSITYNRGTSFVLGRHGNGGTNHDFKGAYR